MPFSAVFLLLGLLFPPLPKRAETEWTELWELSFFQTFLYRGFCLPPTTSFCRCIKGDSKSSTKTTEMENVTPVTPTKEYIYKSEKVE